MKNKSYRILILQVAPKDLDLGLGILFQKGIATVQQKRSRHGLWLLAQIPFDQDPKAILQGLLKYKTLASGRRVFLSLKHKTVLKGPWARAFQKHLKPFPLLTPTTKGLAPLWIDPRKRPKKSPSGITLSIEPGLAFGTGTHPTTRLSALLLAETLQAKKKAAVLDLGCGTGILAMTAKLMGASRIWAVDNDPTALDVAAENFRKNKIKGILLKESFREAKRPFDVIVGNILFSVLFRLKKEIVSKLAPGGFLILSGLLYKDCEPLLKEYRELPLIRRVNEKGWSALLLKKPQ